MVILLSYQSWLILFKNGESVRHWLLFRNFGSNRSPLYFLLDNLGESESVFLFLTVQEWAVVGSEFLAFITKAALGSACFSVYKWHLPFPFCVVLYEPHSLERKDGLIDITRVDKSDNLDLAIAADLEGVLR